MSTRAAREAFGPPPDIEKIKSCIRERRPSELWQDISAAHLDPTDVLSFADLLSMFLKSDDHAIALYSGALKELEDHPERMSSDTDLMAAWVSLFTACSRRGRTEEALRAYYKAARMGYDDVQSKLLVATHLHALGRYTDSLEVVTELLGSATVEDGPGQLPAGMYDLARRLRSELTDKVARNAPSSLVELAWYYNDDLEPIPDGIPNLSFAELERKGLRPDILASLRSAFIFQVSNDRKVWYVSFYDRSDPSPLIERNDFGQFMIWFYVVPESGALRGFDVRPSR